MRGTALHGTALHGAAPRGMAPDGRTVQGPPAQGPPDHRAVRRQGYGEGDGSGGGHGPGDPAHGQGHGGGHGGHVPDGGGTDVLADVLSVLLPALCVLVLAGGYLLLLRAAARRTTGRTHSPWRTGSYLTGCLLLAVALLPPLAPFAHGDFRGHMVQHMLVGMYAPLALVLGAPVTVLLRALPARHARRITGLLHSRAAKLLANPGTALILSVGSLAVLYCTPLYNATMSSPGLHWLMNGHFLLAGWLFAWVVAGPDPAPARPDVPVRLVVLGVAVAVHASVSQLLYGGFLTDVRAPVPEVRAAAEIMYYGGDLAELLLAAALVATWRPVRKPRRTPRARRPRGPLPRRDTAAAG